MNHLSLYCRVMVEGTDEAYTYTHTNHTHFDTHTFYFFTISMFEDIRYFPPAPLFQKIMSVEPSDC